MAHTRNHNESNRTNPKSENLRRTSAASIRKGYTTRQLVRYADDFTIICNTKEEAQWWKDALSNWLQEKVGVELSEEKTKITHISEGFNFLGFNVRKYYPKSRPKAID